MMVTWLPDVLAAAGVRYVCEDTWPGKGDREYSVDTVKVVWHHDASPDGPSPGALDWVKSGSPEAWANIWVDTAGVWHLVSAKQTAHAGVTDGSASNQDSIGIETDHTTGESWPAALLDSLRRGTAAILKHQGLSAQSLFFHKQIARPLGRKQDPDGLEIGAERATVQALIDEPSRPKPPTDAKPPIPPADWMTMASKQDLIDAIKAAQPAEVIFFRVANGTIYQAWVSAGRYAAVGNLDDLRDRKAVLDRSGTKWMDWASDVKNPAAFGVEVKA